MTSKAFDQNLCLISFIDHDSCVCLSRLGMLIDPQNMNVAVHIRVSLCYDTRRSTTGTPSAF